MVPGKSDGFVNDWFLYDEELKSEAGEVAGLSWNQTVGSFCRKN
jgi:hypothetical protein